MAEIRPITATQTKKSISFIRNEIGDIEYKIYKTNDELLYKLNDSIDEICRETLCLESNFNIPIIPDKWQYDLLDLIDTPFNILRVNRIAIYDKSNVEDTRNPLSPVTLETFHKKRKLGPITRHPKYYCFDGLNFQIWKPYSIIGYKIGIDCAREFMDADKADYDKDPPGVITTKYMKFAEMGAIYKAIAPKVELQERLNAGYYEKEYSKYKMTGSISNHLDNNISEFNELNLE